MIRALISRFRYNWNIICIQDIRRKKVELSNKETELSHKLKRLHQELFPDVALTTR